MPLASKVPRYQSTHVARQGRQTVNHLLHPIFYAGWPGWAASHHIAFLFLFEQPSRVRGRCVHGPERDSKASRGADLPGQGAAFPATVSPVPGASRSSCNTTSPLLLTGYPTTATSALTRHTRPALGFWSKERESDCRDCSHHSPRSSRPTRYVDSRPSHRPVHIRAVQRLY